MDYSQVSCNVFFIYSFCLTYQYFHSSSGFMIKSYIFGCVLLFLKPVRQNSLLNKIFAFAKPRWTFLFCGSKVVTRKSSGDYDEYSLPMIDMYPGDQTCILSTLEFISNLAAKHKISPVVTFDQPPFWKASEIVNNAEDRNPVRNVILLLRRFHTLMNLLGAIGTLMDGSGLKDILETIFGQNSLIHIMSGKTLQCALRGHLLLDQCLTDQIISRIIDSEPGFECLIQELEQLHCKTEYGEIKIDEVLRSECMAKIVHASTSTASDLSDKSKTSKLWLNYLRMLGVVRELIEADRSSS